MIRIISMFHHMVPELSTATAMHGAAHRHISSENTSHKSYIEVTDKSYTEMTEWKITCIDKNNH